MKAPTQTRQDWIRGRREKRKLARTTRLRRQVFRLALLFGLVFAAVSGFVYLPWTLTNASAQITIHGNRVTTDNQVRATMTSALGKPLYKVNPKELEKQVCTLPSIRYAFVRRHALPTPGLDVQVLEEFPWASFCENPDAEPEAVISQSGRRIPTKDFPNIVKPQLRFCGSSAFAMSPADVARWDELVRLVGDQIGQPVSAVDMRQPAKIVIFCGDFELHVGQSDSSLSRRLRRLNSVLPAAVALKNNLKYVDLSLDSNVPLKIDRSTGGAGKDGELLHEAVKALATAQ